VGGDGHGDGTVSSERGDGRPRHTRHFQLLTQSAGKTLRGFRFPGCVWAKNPDINPTPTPLGKIESCPVYGVPVPARVLTRASVERQCETAGSVGVLASVYGISSRMRDLRDSGMSLVCLRLPRI